MVPAVHIYCNSIYIYMYILCILCILYNSSYSVFTECHSVRSIIMVRTCALTCQSNSGCEVFCRN